jgi:hypothetical protein
MTTERDMEFFECVCSSDEHTLKVTVYTDPENGLSDFYFSIYLCQYRSFFRRLVAGIKYIFGYKSKYGDFESFILQPKDYAKLASLLKKADLDS